MDGLQGETRFEEQGTPQELQSAPAQVIGDDGAAAGTKVDDGVAQAREDCEAALEERDARIAALEGEIAEAAKTAESAEALRKEMDELRRKGGVGRNAREVMAPKIEATGLGDCTRNVGYKIGSITYEFETKTFNYDRGIKLLVDVMDVEKVGTLDYLDGRRPCITSYVESAEGATGRRRGLGTNLPFGRREGRGVTQSSEASLSGFAASFFSSELTNLAFHSR